MSHIDVFKRYEIKYILTARQKAALMEALEGRMEIDEYGRTTIRNVYYDTPDKSLIRRSLEQPVYKEKLRLRSYSRVNEDENVFVEIKKKYAGIVYKRRTAVKLHQAESWLIGDTPQPYFSQITDEIEYMRRHYKNLEPSCFISYEREAYFPVDGSSLRLTLDENILGRSFDLSLLQGIYGDYIIGKELTLMELKSPGALPMWITEFLSGNGIYKTSFSKYGTYYKNNMNKTRRASSIKGGLRYA